MNKKSQDKNSSPHSPPHFPFARIYVTGVSAAGKSDLARRISDALRLPYVELDALYWKTNWVGATDLEMSDNLRQELSKDKWVIDGRQDLSHDTLIVPRSQVVIWLDLPLHVITYQVIKRTLERATKRRRLWAGNIENPRLAIVNWIRFTFVAYYRLRRSYIGQYRDSPDLEFALIRLRNRKQIRGLVSML